MFEIGSEFYSHEASAELYSIENTVRQFGVWPQSINIDVIYATGHRTIGYEGFSVKVERGRMV